MRALTFDRPHHVVVRDKPDPRIEHPQDGIVRVTAAAICGSDLHLLHGLVPDTRTGQTFGHEIVGVVEELGPEATGLSVGDRVLLPFPIFCGTCFYCQRGLTSSCENTNPATDAACGVYGYGHLTGGYDGGQAQYVRAPFVAVDAERIPEDLDDLQALPLTDALSTGYFGAEMCGLQGGETVAVFGAGPVGLFAMRSLWLMGAGRVIAVDRVPYRLDFARRWAGAETLHFEEVDVITAIKGMTDGRGADATLDAVGCEAEGSATQRLAGVYGKLQAGSTAAFNGCVHATRKGGTVSVIGVYGPPFAAFDLGTAMNKQQTIRTGQCPVKRYLPHLMDHVRSGRIDPRPLFTHRLPLEQAERGYRLFEKRQDGCIKVALFPGEGATIH